MIFLEDNFILHKDFLRHNSQKTLRVNTATDYPIISALRVDKYKKKGYSISKGEFIKILMIINRLDLQETSLLFNYLKYQNKNEKVYVHRLE